MKQIITIFALFIGLSCTQAQVENPVKWTFSTVKKADKKYQLIATATIEGEWHLYSQSTPDGGPIPTSFSFNKNPLATLVGKPIETGKLITKHEKVFGVDVKYYNNKVVFTQDIALKSNVKTNVSGEIEFMVCNDERCLPPKTISFDFKIQ